MLLARRTAALYAARPQRAKVAPRHLRMDVRYAENSRGSSTYRHWPGTASLAASIAKVRHPAETQLGFRSLAGGLTPPAGVRQTVTRVDSNPHGGTA